MRCFLVEERVVGGVPVVCHALLCSSSSLGASRHSKLTFEPKVRSKFAYREDLTMNANVVYGPIFLINSYSFGYLKRASK